MATNIYNFNGTLLTTVADGTIDTTHSTLKFPGKGYQNYGEPVLEDVLWTMTNFAGANTPALPLTGQAWFNTNTNVLNIYNGTTWQAAGGVLVSATKPSSGSNVGAFWYDSVNLQLYVWDGTTWDLVGPLGSAINGDPVTNGTIPTFSQIDSSKISDGYATHQVWRLTIGGVLFAIISKDPAFTPNPGISGFTQILPGINFNTNIPGVGLNGDSTTFKSTQTNLPISDNTYNLGSSSNRFSSIYGLNGSFGTSMTVGNLLSGGYTFHVTGSSYFNGPVSFSGGSLSSAPITLSKGSLLSTPVLGALEFDGNYLYITINENNAVTRATVLAGTAAGNVQAIPNTLALRDQYASIYGNLFVGTATSALYADVAERYATDTTVYPGDVVVIGGEKEITTTTLSYDPTVFGVISTNPAVRMNESAGTDETHPFVALVGRVPCKVIGKVMKGQRLVTSSQAGVAMAAMETDKPYTAFARSLVNKETEGIELIEVVLLGKA